MSDRMPHRGKLPGWRSPSGAGCVIHPEAVVEVWKDGQRTVYAMPRYVSCVDPEHHDHGVDDDDAVR